MAMTTDPDIAFCGGNFVCPRDPTAAQRHALIAALKSIGISSEESDLGGGCVAVIVNEGDGHWAISNAYCMELDQFWSASFWSLKGARAEYAMPRTSVSAFDVAKSFKRRLYGTWA
jgi:hypothetical protein